MTVNANATCTKQHKLKCAALIQQKNCNAGIRQKINCPPAKASCAVKHVVGASALVNCCWQRH